MCSKVSFNFVLTTAHRASHNDNAHPLRQESTPGPMIENAIASRQFKFSQFAFWRQVGSATRATYPAYSLVDLILKVIYNCCDFRDPNEMPFTRILVFPFEMGSGSILGAAMCLLIFGHVAGLLGSTRSSHICMM